MILYGRHYQNAYVTRNVDKAVAGFRQRADIRKLMETEVEIEVTTPKGKGPCGQKLAFIWVGDLNYELVQPMSGLVDVYRDALPQDDGLQFHHVCHVVDDWADLRARIEKDAFPVVLEGASGDQLKFVYLDTRPWLGHYLEYVWMTPTRWAQMGGR